jgi:hypothetical protein
MTKEDLVQGIGKPILIPLGFLQLLLLLLFLSSPFVWIWHSWSLAWKLGVTGLFGCIFVFLIYKLVKQSITNIVDSEIEKQTPKNGESKFQKKLQEILKQRELNNQ